MLVLLPLLWLLLLLSSFRYYYYYYYYHNYHYNHKYHYCLIIIIVIIIIINIIIIIITIISIIIINVITNIRIIIIIVVVVVIVVFIMQYPCIAICVDKLVITSKSASLLWLNNIDNKLVSNLFMNCSYRTCCVIGCMLTFFSILHIIHVALVHCAIRNIRADCFGCGRG